MDIKCLEAVLLAAGIPVRFDEVGVVTHKLEAELAARARRAELTASGNCCSETLFSELVRFPNHVDGRLQRALDLFII